MSRLLLTFWRKQYLSYTPTTLRLMRFSVPTNLFKNRFLHVDNSPSQMPSSCKMKRRMTSRRMAWHKSSLMSVKTGNTHQRVSWPGLSQHAFLVPALNIPLNALWNHLVITNSINVLPTVMIPAGPRPLMSPGCRANSKCSHPTNQPTFRPPQCLQRRPALHINWNTA